MDPSTFDRISQLLAAKSARRSALAGAAGATALAALPEAEAMAKPGRGKLGAAKKKGKKPKQEEKTMFLFLQTARSGTLSDNGDGSFDLVLEGHHGGTIYFSDRPQRVFGVSPTEQFLDGLGFPPDNPPNAALLVNAGDVEDVAIVELYDPAYDEASGRLTYKVRILEAYDETGLDHVADQITDAELPAAFDQASLFIDDCQDYIMCCSDRVGDASWCQTFPYSHPPAGRCWDWSSWACGDCWSDEYDNLRQFCIDTFGEKFHTPAYEG